MKQPKKWKELKRHELSSQYADLVGDQRADLLASIKKGFNKRKPIYLLTVKL